MLLRKGDQAKMATTRFEDSAFIEEVIDSDLLGKAIEWMQEQLTPDQVFDKSELIEHIQDAYGPGDVFSESDLGVWAEENDFVKKEE